MGVTLVIRVFRGKEIGYMFCFFPSGWVWGACNFRVVINIVIVLQLYWGHSMAEHPEGMLFWHHTFSDLIYVFHIYLLY